MNSNYIIEYIWLDSNNDFKSKIKIIDYQNLDDFKNEHLSYYDSSQKKEITLKPIAKFINPFFSMHTSYLILCVSSDVNDRDLAYETNIKYSSQNTLFGIKQEYFILDKVGNLPVNFKNTHIHLKDKHSFSSIGNYYRFAQKHLLLCLNTGINILDVTNEENGLWSFTIKPSNLVETSDHLVVARYILFRLCEEYKCIISFSPKEQIFPKCIVNISNDNTRSIDGINHINNAIYNLESYHNIKSPNEYYDVKKFGRYNEIEKYKFKTGFTNEAITMPNKNLGIFEDNRHAAYSNPYLLLSLLLQEINDKLKLIDSRVMSDVNYII